MSQKEPVTPRTDTPAPDELDAWLTAHPAWTVSATPRPDMPGATRTELSRAYRFRTFTDALGFMVSAAPFIDRTDHHPRWENAHRTVTVWLSTWDANHAISARDLALAEHLDTVFARLAPPVG